jgi:hypothetical protein
VKEHPDFDTDRKTQVFLQEGSEITKILAGTEEEILQQIETQLNLHAGEYTLGLRFRPGAKWQSIRLKRKVPQEQKQVTRLVVKEGQMLEDLYEAAALSGVPKDQIMIKDSRGRKMKAPKRNQTAWISHGHLKGWKQEHPEGIEKAEHANAERGDSEDDFDEREDGSGRGGAGRRVEEMPMWTLHTLGGN